MQENTVVNTESLTGTPLNWQKLNDFSIQVSQLGLTFCANTFFFRIANKALQQLTSAGIMQWMIDNKINALHKIKTQKEPKQLTVESLSFGFIIWLAFCGFSVVTFLGEYFYMKLSRTANALKKYLQNLKTKNRKIEVKNRRKTKRLKIVLRKKIYSQKFLKTKVIRKNKKNRFCRPRVKNRSKVGPNSKSTKAFLRAHVKQKCK